MVPGGLLAGASGEGRPGAGRVERRVAVCHTGLETSARIPGGALSRDGPSELNRIETRVGLQPGVPVSISQ